MFRRLRTLAFLTLLPAALSCAGAPDDSTRLASSGPRYFGATAAPKGQVFTFNNGAEPETIDPSLMTGQPDGRIARTIFEGLTIPHPETLEPQPAQAYRWDISEDGLIYTFHLRPGLVWSDDTPLTADDFRWTWLRVLNPATASRYASFLYPVDNAEAFNKGEIEDETRVGVAAPDDSTFVVRLGAPTPYFLQLTNFYTMLPAPRKAIAEHGNRWTRPENVVSNGPFLLDFWRQGDRFEFVPNPTYWDAENVRLERIIAYSISDLNTSTNLYKAGIIDWNPSGFIPSQYIPYLRNYDDYRHGRYHGIYFYSMNVSREPFDNVWVRKALNYAVDREAITVDLLKGSRDPWGCFTPSGYPGYTQPEAITYDPERAREYLTRAGYPNGEGFPKIDILFNTSEDHRRIAEAIQAMWKRDLGIDVELSNQEWGSYLQATSALQYDTARRSWIGDYLDPFTFLSLVMGGDGNNRTGWSHPRYDQLLRQASNEMDSEKRFAMLREAEAILLDEGPMIPIYHYSTNEMVKPYVRGLYATALDTHPLHHVWIDHDWQKHPAPVARANDAAGGEGADAVQEESQ